ncbi:MAG: molybdenum cofactor guanylyltransferase MobA [Siculibacillus sp.]|nr:molybdenum cofactor guanylyltransferase MobA [Siculibacillus sp.]
MSGVGVGGIAGLVLAGGLSRRMGGEKSQRLLGGRPMIAHVIARFAPQVGATAISANSPHDLHAQFGLPILADLRPGHAGPLAGIEAGLDWAGGLAGVTHLATAATDAPFVPRDLVARCAARIAPGRIVLARSPSGDHPIFGLWPLVLRADLSDWLESSPTMKVFAWIRRHDVVWCDFDPEALGGPDPFFNANTPEDLAEAEAHLARRAG